MEESKTALSERSLSQNYTEQQPTRRQIVFSPSSRYFAAIAPGHRTIVYDSRTMKQHAKHKISAKLLAFQYDTGLVAMVPVVHDNKVVLWDFKYDRNVREVDFVQPIVQMAYMRNLLIVASTQRLVMNDLSTGQNVVYLPLIDGEKCLINSFYEKLRIGYFQNSSKFVSLSMWDDQKVEIQQIHYTRGRFDYRGDTLMLYSTDGIFIYRERCLTNRIKYSESELVECIFDSSGLDQARGIILVLNRQSLIVVEWYPIYRLTKQDEKRCQVHYQLKYEEILEEDQKEIGENILVYLREGDLYISRPGETTQVYRKVQFVE